MVIEFFQPNKKRGKGKASVTEKGVNNNKHAFMPTLPVLFLVNLYSVKRSYESAMWRHYFIFIIISFIFVTYSSEGEQERDAVFNVYICKGYKRR